MTSYPSEVYSHTTNYELYDTNVQIVLSAAKLPVYIGLLRAQTSKTLLKKFQFKIKENIKKVSLFYLKTDCFSPGSSARARRGFPPSQLLAGFRKHIHVNVYTYSYLLVACNTHCIAYKWLAICIHAVEVRLQHEREASSKPRHKNTLNSKEFRSVVNAHQSLSSKCVRFVCTAARRV